MRKVSLAGLAMVWGGVFTTLVVGQEAAKPAQAPASSAPTIDQ